MNKSATENISEIKNMSNKKRSKFVELAEKRTINAIRSIRIIGKLGNPNAYDYEEDDVKKIINALNKEIESLRQMMIKKGAKDSIEFKL